jgi:hypothetical protein
MIEYEFLNTITRVTPNKNKSDITSKEPQKTKDKRKNNFVWIIPILKIDSASEICKSLKILRVFDGYA